MKVMENDRNEPSQVRHLSHHCVQLGAYWIPPPSWPRRLLCDNCSFGWFTLRESRACWWIACVCVLTYFVIMDIVLYAHFKKSNLVHDSKGGDSSEIYTPFTHLSVKALMSDQPSQFLKTPSAEYFNRITGFSSNFAFITPNMISTTHLICAFISGKLIASSILNDRRIGVAIFCFRSWLDALDGTVFRAQSGKHLQFKSNPSTLGYYIDAIFDTLGGFFLCFGILFYLVKRFQSNRKNFSIPLLNGTSPKTKALSLPLMNGSTKSNNNSSSAHAHDPVFASGEEYYTVTYLFGKTLTLGMCLGVAGLCWNTSMQELTNVFQTEIQDENLSLLQFEYCHSTSSICVFMMWRLVGSMAILNYILLAIFCDRIWEMMQGPQLILLILNIIMYGVTYLYVRQIKSTLQL